ncbi:hypothetical protein ACWCPM_14595 [Streptomyces sp. NPDC002309]
MAEASALFPHHVQRTLTATGAVHPGPGLLRQIINRNGTSRRPRPRLPTPPRHWTPPVTLPLDATDDRSRGFAGAALGAPGFGGGLARLWPA